MHTVNDVTYLASPDEMRQWLSENHDQVSELWLGIYKKDSGKMGVTYKQAVDEALCFGWIDGLTRKVDEASYKVRFTPRKPRSIWSQVNLKRIEELIQLGRMQPPGLKAYTGRDPAKTNLYANEQPDLKLDDAYERELQANEAAWTFFQAQSAAYQRTATWYVMSAKQEVTRCKRLIKLIEACTKGEKVAALIGKRKEGGQRLQGQ
ncbi:MAG: YdeI/OmpD-associated family protein [Burkholderiales bacterium]|nr:YdeI/OmpD-associated family protein [Anaerolineae bacterium]